MHKIDIGSNNKNRIPDKFVVTGFLVLFPGNLCRITRHNAYFNACESQFIAHILKTNWFCK